LPMFVGIDMALKHDSIAVVLCQPQGHRLVVRAKVWIPDGAVVWQTVGATLCGRPTRVIF